MVGLSDEWAATVAGFDGVFMGSVTKLALLHIYSFRKTQNLPSQVYNDCAWQSSEKPLSRLTIA